MTFGTKEIYAAKKKTKNEEIEDFLTNHSNEETGAIDQGGMVKPRAKLHKYKNIGTKEQPNWVLVPDNE